MAKKPNVPCAGGCGRLLWSGGRQARHSAATCRGCRGQATTSTQALENRRAAEHARTLRRRAARQATRPASHRCMDCMVEITPQARRCPPCRHLLGRTHNQAKCALRRSLGRGRKKKAGMSVFDLGDREGWRCHLCGGKVDRSLKAPDAGSPSFDHLIPVSEGGLDVAVNLRLAHLGCNVKRGTGGVVQLLLVA